MAKMTKSQILESLANSSGLAKKQVASFLDAMTALAYKEVKANGEFTVPGFGKLVKKHRDARQGRNPATGATIQIPARTVLKFRVSKAAKDSIL